MSMICSLCGKKQSGFIQDYPIDVNHVAIRICSSCDENIKKLIKLSNTNIEEYEIEYRLFQNLINKNKINVEVINILNTLKEKCDYNISILKKERMLKEEAENRKLAELEKYNNFLMTSGFNFEGLEIVKYNKVICEQVVLGTGFLSELTANIADFFGVESTRFANKLDECRQICTEKLIDRAISVGANAIIGVDFDYTIFTNNIIGVIINGTAVTVKST